MSSDSESEGAGGARPWSEVWVSSDDAEQAPPKPGPSGTSPSGVWVSSDDGDAEHGERADALHEGVTENAEARERCAKRPRSRGAQSKPEGSGSRTDGRRGAGVGGGGGVGGDGTGSREAQGHAVVLVEDTEPLVID